MEMNPVSPEELEQLIERVADQLQQRLESQKKLEKESGTQETFLQTEPKPRRKILLIGELKDEEIKTLAASYTLTEDLHCLEYESLLIARMSVETMAYVAHGISGNPQAAGILQGLLLGRQVFLLEQGLEYHRYKECAGKMMYRLCQKQEDMLKGMGILFLHHVIDAFDYTKSVPDCSSKEAMDYRKCRLLQEVDVIRARGMGYQAVLLDRNTKITPLAMDYITNHNLTIRRQ